MYAASKDVTSAQARERRFGWVIAGKTRGPDSRFDLDLGTSPVAAVVPSLGALIPEWLLVIPRQPCLSIAELPRADREAIARYTFLVAKAVAHIAGHSVIFEHGAGQFGSLNGCGVDQAHLHVVGLRPGFAGWTQEQTPDLPWAKINQPDPWRNFRSGEDYFLIIEDLRAIAARAERPATQFLRMMVAKFLSRADEWDYKQHPNEENAQRTIELFSDTLSADRT